MGHREDLLAGAKRCLFEKGFARTTARDIVAASGTNLGSIGYHYGSTQALMQAAMLSAIEDWGEAVGAALAADAGDEPADPLVRYWQRVIGSIHSHRALWLASVDAMIQTSTPPSSRHSWPRAWSRAGAAWPRCSPAARRRRSTSRRYARSARRRWR